MVMQLFSRKRDAYNYRGTSPTFADLPATGNAVRDLMLNIYDNKVYEWNGTAWVQSKYTAYTVGASATPQAVIRSTGYLQGGYKDTTTHSSVQLFNTNTQTGKIVTTTPYARKYTPGVSGDQSGFFSMNDTTQFAKFSFINQTYASSFYTNFFPKVTSHDFGIATVAWIVGGSNAFAWDGAYGANVSQWSKLDLINDTPVNKGSLDAATDGNSRQALSTSLVGAFGDMNAGRFIVMNYATDTVSNSITNSLINQTALQIPCGLSRSDTIGYYVGLSQNTKITFTGTSVSAMSTVTRFGWNFGESHSVSSDTTGFMMAGYSDNSGRYGGTQHGLCQKIAFATEAITTLPDLVLPQSSGQMMQGF